MNLRLFVALDPPDLVRRRLSALSAELRRALGTQVGEVRWVDLDKVHLTLQFLGAVPEERLPAVRATVEAAAEGAAPLHLEVRGAGAFPNARRARVLWAGVEGELSALGELVLALGRGLAPLGFPPEERAYSPHLTLGRARDPRGVGGLAAALGQAAALPGAPWHASEVVLFASHLSPQGPRYEPLLRAGLGRGKARGPL
ncbi:MAG TPA: RNA 2',3'-cyclic phosphodiesterase [Anaeromyxobacteraceae bacterium]|nr:RNA 2',3'-cyclic phosphodiesterase [Anaeromyxobacteraceae bacterium]